MTHVYYAKLIRLVNKKESNIFLKVVPEDCVYEHIKKFIWSTGNKALSTQTCVIMCLINWIARNTFNNSQKHRTRSTGDFEVTEDKEKEPQELDTSRECTWFSNLEQATEQKLYTNFNHHWIIYLWSIIENINYFHWSMKLQWHSNAGMMMIKSSLMKLNEKFQKSPWLISNQNDLFIEKTLDHAHQLGIFSDDIGSVLFLPIAAMTLQTMMNFQQ
ncbi:hypothetical protein EDD85DRAFT_792112 [Armillaria nabsnona]|nr:hypothetical protein EDD85DRAFT_792112 [Armillaria nabsnona]